MLSSKIHKQLDGFLTELPNAIVSSQGWRGVVSSLADIAGVPHGFIAARTNDGVLQFEAERLWENEFVHGYDGERGVTEYLEYYRQFDEWDGAELGQGEKPVLATRVPDFEFCPKSEFWDWANPLDLNESAYTKLFDTNDGFVGLNLQFDKNSVDADHVLEVVNRTYHPLALCLQLYSIGVTQSFDRSLQSELEKCPYPRAIFSSLNKCFATNNRFDDLLNTKDVFFSKFGLPCLRDSSKQREFETSLAKVFQDRMPKVIRLQEAKSGKPSLLILAPYEMAGSLAFQVKTGVMLTYFVQKPVQSKLIALGEAYGFNLTKRKILSSIYDGYSLKQISEQTGLSYFHVRGIAAELYRELEVSGHAGLMSFISNYKLAEK